jgi:hypothetical protein
VAVAVLGLFRDADAVVGKHAHRHDVLRQGSNVLLTRGETPSRTRDEPIGASHLLTQC